MNERKADSHARHHHLQKSVGVSKALPKLADEMAAFPQALANHASLSPMDTSASEASEQITETVEIPAVSGFVISAPYGIPQALTLRRRDDGLYIPPISNRPLYNLHTNFGASAYNLEEHNIPALVPAPHHNVSADTKTPPSRIDPHDDCGAVVLQNVHFVLDGGEVCIRPDVQEAPPAHKGSVGGFRRHAATDNNRQHSAGGTYRQRLSGNTDRQMTNTRSERSRTAVGDERQEGAARSARGVQNDSRDVDAFRGSRNRRRWLRDTERRTAVQRFMEEARRHVRLHGRGGNAGGVSASGERARVATVRDGVRGDRADGRAEGHAPYAWSDQGSRDSRTGSMVRASRIESEGR